MRRLSLYFILLCISLSSCRKDGGDCFVSTGPQISEIRQLTDFSSLKMLDNVDVELVSGDEYAVEVTAGKNIISNIRTEVIEIEKLHGSITIKTNQLVIQNFNQCDWLRSYDKPIKVRISYVKDIESVEYRSIGDLTCLDTIKSDTFLIDIYEGSGKINLQLQNVRSHLNYYFGTADLTVKGTSKVNYIYQTSYGPIYASEFIVNFNYLENRGTNDCYVYAKVFLGAVINSIGNVYYAGNPTDKQLVKNGSGNFYELD